MNKLQTFANTLVKSVSSPAYYADVIKAKMSFSLKYFLMLTFLLSIITAAKIIVPLSLFNVPAAADQLASQYPADLDVKVQNGRLSINKPLPYAVPVRSNDHEGPANIVVFEADKNVASPQDFYKYDTYALVTESSIYTNQDSNDSTIKVYQIPQDTQDFELNAPLIKEYENKFLAMPAVKNKLYVPAAALAMLILLVPLMYLFRLSTAYTYALIMYVVLKIFGESLVNGTQFSVGKLFQVTLHTMTLPILLAYALAFTPYYQLEGLLYFFVYAIFTFICLKAATRGTVPLVRSTDVKPASAVVKTSVKKTISKKKK